MTYEAKLAADYANMSIPEAYELDIIDFWLYARDGYIHRLNQTEHGREYLEKCWILEQTAPDRQTLKKKFGAQP